MSCNDGQRRSRPWDVRRDVTTPVGWTRAPARPEPLIISSRRRAVIETVRRRVLVDMRLEGRKAVGGSRSPSGEWAHAAGSAIAVE